MGGSEGKQGEGIGFISRLFSLIAPSVETKQGGKQTQLSPPPTTCLYVYTLIRTLMKYVLVISAHRSISETITTLKETVWKGDRDS